MTTKNEVELIRQAGVFGIERIGNGWETTCSCCGKRYRLNMSVQNKADELAALMRRKGWTVEKKIKPVCTACNQEAKEALKMNARPHNLAPDMKIARRVMNALEDHFDEAKKLFKPGWSDDKIAGELGVSLQIVASIRKEAFGELAEDPVVTGLRDEVELLRMELGDKVNALLKDFTKKLAEIEARIPKKKAIC